MSTCIRKDCDRVAVGGKRRCYWHFINELPMDQQIRYADERLRLWSEQHDNYRIARLPAAEVQPGTRWCAGCQHLIPLWYASGSRCRACSARARHGAHVQKTYGITEEEYKQLYDAQGGRCAVCGRRSLERRLAVDHEHATGDVRGLLCKTCNHDVLGWLTTPEQARALLSYLLLPPARRMGIGQSAPQ